MNLEKIIPQDGPSIYEVEKYIKKYSNELIVVKAGGSVLLDENLFKQFIEDISVIYRLGLSVIVVHGGGKNIKKKLDDLNIETNFIDGLRVTDEKTIKVVEEALLELNSEITKNLKDLQTNVQSVTPKNENIIKIIPEKKELGFVGIPKEVNKEVLLNIIGEKILSYKSNSIGKQTINLDLSSYSNGIYNLHLKLNNTNYNRKFILQ